MNSLSPAGIAALLLASLLLIAGCAEPPSHDGSGEITAVTTVETTGAEPGENPVSSPGTTGLCMETIPLPAVTVTECPTASYRSPSQADLVADYTIGEEKDLAFTYNSTAYTCLLGDTPVIIEYSLMVPNITRPRITVDPLTGNDKTISLTYPDPGANFEVTVRDLENDEVIARDGYGGEYGVLTNKKIRVHRPGSYYLEFSGHRVAANVKFWIKNET